MRDAYLELIIVTHNSAQFLAGLAQSFTDILAEVEADADAPGPPAARDISVIIADTGSTDDTPACAKAAFPAAVILPLPNIGYGAAANVAIARARAPWVLLCNADITFEPGFGRHMIGSILTGALPGPPEFAHEKTAIVAPELRNPDGTLQPSIGIFPTLGSVVCDQFRPRPWRKYVSHPPTAPARINWATGACLLLRKAAFESVGGFDEKYFLYVEEVDLQKRLAMAGFHGIVLPDAKVTHHAPNAARAPRAAAQKWAARGMLRYFAAHGNAADRIGFGLLALASGRLSPGDALASCATILSRATGPQL